MSSSEYEIPKPTNIHELYLLKSKSTFQISWKVFFLSFTTCLERRLNLVSLCQWINDWIVQLDGSFFA